MKSKYLKLHVNYTEVAIHSFAFLYGGKNVKIWGYACFLGSKFFLPADMEETFPSFEWASVKKVKAELICNLKIQSLHGLDAKQWQHQKSSKLKCQNDSDYIQGRIAENLNCWQVFKCS